MSRGAWDDNDLQAHGPTPARLDIDRVTFRLKGGQLRIDGQVDEEPVTLQSLVQLERMVSAAIKKKRAEMEARR